jgi:NAD(P)-dependent dehydrogenase (short-subunit alcohol dehydrogenase family)
LKIDLPGKLAIVTGSAGGIGFSIAHGLAACGPTVVVNGRKRSARDRAISDVGAAVPGTGVRGVPADLSIPDIEWTRFFEVNVMSGVRLSRAYLPAMLERNWGRVVFLSSESGLNIPPEMIHYSFTKTAVLAIARGLAKRVAGTGVTVNSVLPGPTF